MFLCSNSSHNIVYFSGSGTASSAILFERLRAEIFVASTRIPVPNCRHVFFQIFVSVYSYLISTDIYKFTKSNIQQALGELRELLQAMGSVRDRDFNTSNGWCVEKIPSHFIAVSCPISFQKWLKQSRSTKYLCPYLLITVAFNCSCR